MKTRNGIGLGLVGLAAWTFAFAADPVASQVTNDGVMAHGYDQLVADEGVMEEIIVRARHPEAERKGEGAAFHVGIDLSDTPIHSAELSESFTFEPEIRLSL